MKNKENGNTSQQHGTDVENLMKTAHMFPGACDAHRLRNAIHDIEGKFDPKFGLDTSIKAVGNGTIGLADATRFYEINIPRRYLVVDWKQINEEEKQLERVHEFIFPLSVLKEIRGNLTAVEVLDYHKRIAAYPAGKDAAAIARSEADWIKKAIAGRHGIVTLDFKIDDYEQRRLQLTVRTKALIEIAEGKPDYEANGHRQPLYTLHEGRFCQYRLPFPILSTKRRIDPAERDRTPDDPQTGVLFELPATTDFQPSHISAAARRTPVRQDERAKAAEGMDRDLQIRLFGS